MSSRSSHVVLIGRDFYLFSISDSVVIFHGVTIILTLPICNHYRNKGKQMNEPINKHKPLHCKTRLIVIREDIKEDIGGKERWY